MKLNNINELNVGDRVKWTGDSKHEDGRKAIGIVMSKLGNAVGIKFDDENKVMMFPSELYIERYNRKLTIIVRNNR